MPNWCGNVLIVEGSNDDLKRFRDAVTVVSPTDPSEVEYKILESLYPTPQELLTTPSGKMITDDSGEFEQVCKENVALHGYKDWYDWRIAKWGTKWSDTDTYVAFEVTGAIGFRFDTAWSPPIKAVEKIATMFPELTFILTYEELGMGYVGAFGCANDYTVDKFSEDIEFPEMGENDDVWDVIHEVYQKEKNKCEEEVRRELAVFA